MQCQAGQAARAMEAWTELMAGEEKLVEREPWREQLPDGMAPRVARELLVVDPGQLMLVLGDLGGP